jgi:hypothetical protein
MSKIFIEDREVVKYEPIEGRKSPMGEPLLKVSFKTGEELIMSSMRFQTVQSSAKSDATAARDKLLKAVSEKFYAISIEYGLRVSEIDALINSYIKLANESQSQANCILWGLKTEQERDLLQVQDVLYKEYGPKSEEKDSKDGAAS